ncbi:MAG: glycosyltransferase family 4 protein [Gemmatimonadota bacterium]
MTTTVARSGRDTGESAAAAAGACALRAGSPGAGSLDARGAMRVLLAIPYYPPVVGGAEVHVSRLAAALSRRGHRVEVLTTYAAPMPRARHWRDTNGVAVTAVGHRLPEAMRPRAYVASVAARVAAPRDPYDVLQLFLPGLHVVSGLAAARLRGTATAVMFGSSLHVPQLRALALGRLQLAAILRWADAVVVLNEEMRQDFRSIGVPDAQIIWLPCSVDTSAFRVPSPEERVAARRALQLADDAFVVTFVGRFDPAKNLAALVRGVGTFARVHPKAVLCLVGDGAERAALEQLATHEAPPACVRFVGQRLGDEVAGILQAADVFAMLSHSEGIPCALVEAMATGLPCLVHDIPALGQLVDDGVHGVRVPVDDAPALQRALSALAGDAATRRRMGMAGREVVRTRFDVDVVAEAHEALYRRAMLHAAAF